MPQEVELKLTLEPDALPAAQSHPALRALKGGRTRTTQLASTYYDTAKAELRAAGVALRVRRDGRRWVQTVKGEGSVTAGLHTREEYEWPIGSARIDGRKLLETPWRAMFASTAPRLKPIFQTHFARTTQPLRFADGTRATLCLDRGEIRAGHRRASLAEIELELVEGRAERLYELALALAADLPVTVALDSKAERGFALAHPIAPQPVRARMVCVARDSRLGTALAGVAADCLRQIGANASRIATGSDSEFLHQLRVGVRRLRSLLKLTSRLVPGERLASLEEEVRWLGDAMSPARDWDVFANEIFPEVIPALHGVAERRDIDMLRRRITNMRRSHQEVVQEVAASPRLQRLLLGLGALFNGLATDSVPPADAPLQRVAALVLAERDRKLRKRGKRIQRMSSRDRHRLRIAAKKLRYVAEFFAPAYPAKRTRDYLAALSKLQGALGRLNDFATAERLLDEIAAPGKSSPRLTHPIGAMRTWISTALPATLDRADDAWQRFLRRKPFW